MSKNRYAIVRVECPSKNEIDAQFVCYPNDNNCSGCRYGDTKEQLINKVEQVLKRSWLNEENQPFKEVAEEIVEFLGVE